MQDLRLVGVHEDGAHLLLADARGERYRLPLDESLRAAARRDRPRLGQLQIEIDGGARPRDVQAMIRAGLTAAEVAERCGWPVAKVHRYEGPILAEREHIAGLGRGVRLRHRGPGGGSTGAAPTLQERVVERLATRGVGADQIAWDSWRRDGSEWAVVVTFAAGGRQRQATWSFDVPTRSLSARDDEARWLSEEEPPDPGAAPVRPDPPVYDVEADGGLQPPARPRPPRATEPVDLMVAMRERSQARTRRAPGRRRLEPVLPMDEPTAPEPDGPLEEAPTPTPAPGWATPTPADPPAASAELQQTAPCAPTAFEPAVPGEAPGRADPSAADLRAQPPVVEAPVEAPVERPVETPVVERPVETPVVERPVETPVVERPVAEPSTGKPARTPPRSRPGRAGRAAPTPRSVGLAALFRGPAAATHEEQPNGQAAPGPEATADATPDQAAEPDHACVEAEREPSRRRPARTPVPSWDDIVLGTRSRETDPAD